MLEKIKRLFSQKKEVAVLKTQKSPVYSVGSPDPRFFVAGSVDIKVYLIDKEGREETFPECQSISIDENIWNDSEITGKLINILYDFDTLKLFPNLDKIKLISCRENGTPVAKCMLEGVILTKRSWGVSIDDLITEIHYDFVAKSCSSWVPLDN